MGLREQAPIGSGTNAFAECETLYESERTRVLRLRSTAGGQTLICKESLGPDSMARQRRELEFLTRLAGIQGVPRLVPFAGLPNAIAMVDTGGVSLAEALRGGPIAETKLLGIASRLAETLAEVHRRGVLHKDINPSNIILSVEGDRPELIDFELASTYARERPNFVHHLEIAGTLAYIAPEQTGRTGRSVDARADLYAFGVTLYESIIGRLPFEDHDPLRMIHDHLARIPTPPIDRSADVSPRLSAIIMKLLEKEPDQRYQSAEGLAFDLARLAEAEGRGETGLPNLGERDFPARLSPPSRLIGREGPISGLRVAFQNALGGRSHGIFIAGAAGVGKTAVIDELRSMVTGKRGWFISGKCDQYRRDTNAGPVHQSFRALGRLLLAEPEAELQTFREQIRQVLGANAGLIASLIPEFAVLLGSFPEVVSSDPNEDEARLRQAIVALLRAVASPERPLVMALDDLQWANPGSIRIIDDILTNDQLRGLLLVGSYRESEVDANNLLSAMLARWERLGVAPSRLKLENLPLAELGTLLEAMLRLHPREAARLAAVIAERTGGNPYDTVELLNALRQDDVLTSGQWGWTWDEATIRRFVGRFEVVDMLADRIARLSEDASRLLEIMACIGGEMTLGLLEDATGLDNLSLIARLSGPLEEGLLLIERGGHRATEREDVVRFRHDRVQQASYGRMTADRRLMMQLGLARRLSALPDRGAEAAELYLPAAGAVRDPDERALVAGLFGEAAIRSRQSTNFATADHFLRAALNLLTPITKPEDEDTFFSLQRERHAVLYSLGCLDEADGLYFEIEQRRPDPLELTDSACIQICSLSNRGRQRDAVTLGLDLLERLGMKGLRDDHALDSPVRLAESDPCDLKRVQAEGLSRPEMNDPYSLAKARIVHGLITPSYLSDPRLSGRLIQEGRRLWVDHGPCAALISSLVGIMPSNTTGSQDYRDIYSSTRYAISVGSARGYEPETSRALYYLGQCWLPWFEPLENTVPVSQKAREGLLQGGDLQYACFTHFPAIFALLDCAPTLEACKAEVEAGFAFAARTGNDLSVSTLLSYRQLLRSLRGETDEPGSFEDSSFDDKTHLAGLVSNPMSMALYHVNRSIGAALFGDTLTLERHLTGAMSLLPAIQSLYSVAHVYLLRAVVLADRLRMTTSEGRDDLLAELDECRDWVALRAADCPENFGHLLRLIEAERARAIGDDWRAASAYDDALVEAGKRQRPWHRALIAERAGDFHLAHGQTRAGRAMIIEARRIYESWGATAKVGELMRNHPFLRETEGPRIDRGKRSSSSGFSSEAIDLLAVLRASQVLSSETDLERLEARISEVLGAMTGANSVLMVLRDGVSGGWYLTPMSGRSEAPIAVEEAGARRLLPLSAFRYAERTLDPLLAEDTACDDRFANDPYFNGLERCSLLVVPILTQGIPCAILILENRLSRGTFTKDRIDTVALLGGQLAISLNNAMLYSSLERRVAERTEALAAANRRLETLSMTDGLTGLANRRHFDEVLAAEWLRAERTGDPIGAAMVDVDQFKPYNDRYGHIAGDRCLRSIASALGESVRRGVDVVARYGGEEFSIILPGAALETALLVAERARASIESLRVPHEDSPFGIVTASLGVAVAYPPTQESAGEFIGRADSALYEAKCHGRNRVACLSGHPVPRLY